MASINQAALGWAVCLPALIGTACGDDDSPSENVRSSYTLSFQARVSDEDAGCGATYSGLGASGNTLSIRDFRIFLSNIRLVDAAGNESPLDLDQATPWQHENVALLDFENGQGGCSETGDARLNDEVTGSSDMKSPTGLRFEIGVPFALNHFETQTQPPPLDILPMWWNWQGGYKFLRIDLETDLPVPANFYNIHLGSTACDSPDRVVPPSSPCGRSNRPRIALNRFDPATDTVVFDLLGLLTGVDTSTNTAGPSGCQSFPPELSDCSTLFSNLGMDFSTGACINDCQGQRFVRAE